ncbi:MAG TPA: hypothetical protein K8W03_01565 [Bifidobacterium pseudolongum subsp. globosum]|uniref:hypothetical protein n=1 Tax=Bifidobacterium pseudolongum TaxID=1694 RepID=UPI001DDDB6C9|nr:hypothetical protein [Bifidobacterium pseudolongum]HJE55458.1 hypothetical protein [Bifidobacterium pseudolongum subsp. globosum]
MPKLRSHWKKAVTVLLSVGIACSTASVAQAAVSMTYTPRSVGSIEGGYYHGSRNVQVTTSQISMYSVNMSSQCVAKQSGNSAPAYQIVSKGYTCSAFQRGTETANGDYAAFEVS